MAHHPTQQRFKESLRRQERAPEVASSRRTRTVAIKTDCATIGPASSQTDDLEAQKQVLMDEKLQIVQSLGDSADIFLFQCELYDLITHDEKESLRHKYKSGLEQI